ncbi:hypothetical protein TrLO_g2459 [Triparma laevis f. longispina]|uniref:Uncharacterized protein n=1 Tax=Triparma laevis f. longispina TaxID=1714387 RepID=A0A9W7FKI6_9STRA|nr:hypothetical protein TrLO_g2459 [Triparma laevis f. longispina]
MVKQTKLKQTTTVVQVLSEASKFNNLPYLQWFLSFSIFGSFFTLPFQPQPACLTELPSYVNGVVIFFALELLIRFLTNLHSNPLLGNRISAKTKERCQVLASILATVTVIPILRVTLDAPTMDSTSYDKISADHDIKAIEGVVIGIIINAATTIFVVSFMYFRIERMTWNYSCQRLEYMKNPEAYQIDEESQLKKGLHYLSSFCANYAKRI